MKNYIKQLPYTIAEQTYEEKALIYKKVTKKKLISMLIAANRALLVLSGNYDFELRSDHDEAVKLAVQTKIYEINHKL